MKKRISLIILTLIMVLVLALPVFADSYKTYFPIIITDTSGVARTNLAVLTGVQGTALINSNYINADGTDTRMKLYSTGTITDTDEPYLMGTTQIPIVIPSLPANGSVEYDLYTGYDPVQTTFPIIVGNGGKVTTPYNIGLEPGSSNLLIDFPGYIDTKAGTDKYILNHPGEIVIKDSTTTDGTVTATITTDSGDNSVTLTGVPSGYYSTAFINVTSGILTFTIGSYSVSFGLNFNLSTSTEISLPAHFNPIPNSMCADASYLYVLASNSNNSNYVSVLKINRSTGVLAAQLDFSYYYDFNWGSLSLDHSRLMFISGSYLYLIEPDSGSSLGYVDKIHTSTMGIVAQETSVDSQPISIASDGTYFYTVSMGEGGNPYHGYINKFLESDMSNVSLGGSAPDLSHIIPASIVSGGSNLYVRGIYNHNAYGNPGTSCIITLAESDGSELDFLNGTGLTTNTQLDYQNGTIYSISAYGISSFSTTIPMAQTNINSWGGGLKSICSDSNCLYIAAQTEIWQIDISTLATLSSGTLLGNTNYSNILVDSSDLYSTDIDSGNSVIRDYPKGTGTIPDTNSTWVWDENNVMPYVDLFDEVIGNPVVLLYQPATIIQGTVLPDLSGNGYNGVITWGSNPADLTISVGTPKSSQSTVYNPNNGASGAQGSQLPSGAQGYQLPTLTQPSNWYGNSSNLVNLPLYGVFLGIYQSSGIPVQTMYFILMMLVAFMLFFFTVMKTHSIMLSAAVLVVLLGMASGTGVIPGWIVYVLAIGSIGILFLARQIG